MVFVRELVELLATRYDDGLGDVETVRASSSASRRRGAPTPGRRSEPKRWRRSRPSSPAIGRRAQVAGAGDGAARGVRARGARAASAALRLALSAMGVQLGHEVLVPVYACVAIRTWSRRWTQRRSRRDRAGDVDAGACWDQVRDRRAHVGAPAGRARVDHRRRRPRPPAGRAQERCDDQLRPRRDEADRRRGRAGAASGPHAETSRDTRDYTDKPLSSVRRPTTR